MKTSGLYQLCNGPINVARLAHTHVPCFAPQPTPFRGYAGETLLCYYGESGLLRR